MGHFLDPGQSPLPSEQRSPTDYSPFENHAAFELSDLLFWREQMSATNINDLLQIWAASLPEDEDPPFNSKQEMYDTIDGIQEGNAPWQSFKVSYNGEIKEGDTTPWKHAEYQYFAKFC